MLHLPRLSHRRPRISTLVPAGRAKCGTARWAKTYVGDKSFACVARPLAGHRVGVLDDGVVAHIEKSGTGVFVIGIAE